MSPAGGAARGIFFDQDSAEVVAGLLRSDGYSADVGREPYAGEDDDEDHAWAVLTDAPEIALELLVDAYEGWLEVEEPPTAAPPDLPRPDLPKPELPKAELPSAPKRRHNP